MSNISSYSRRFTDEEPIERLLKTLADDDCRRILQSLQQAQAPMSAPELVGCCEIARSTVYRKLDLLEQTVLVDTRIRLSKTGTHITEYDITFQELRVKRGANSIELVVRYYEEDSQAGKQGSLLQSGSSSN
jgi:predicted transcriptional regulator